MVSFGKNITVLVTAVQAAIFGMFMSPAHVIA